MVKAQAKPCAKASDVKAATRRYRLRGKKLSEEAILETQSEPHYPLRKCVVKIRRTKFAQNAVPSGSQNVPPDVDTSAFLPARNSTMYVPQKVQIEKKPKFSKKEVAGPPSDKPPQDMSSAKPSRFFHRDQPPTRTRSSVIRNVFDFLSQSEIEDDNSREDPAADIVKRMVKDGKACVMVRSAKSGKTRVKPMKKKIRPVGKRKKVSLKDEEPEPVQIVPKVKELRMQKPSCPLSPIYEPEDDSRVVAEEGYMEPTEVPVQVHVQPSPSKQAHDGTYSNLARSAMLNQTHTQNPQNSKNRRRELINMARQLVSTPIVHKVHPAPNANVSAVAISPISRPSPTAGSPSGGASPWRVSDESPMPNTFMFGFNTSQLPSYSSDHVRRRHVYVPDVQAEQTKEPVHEESICPALHEQSHGSNANDSNEENRPPPTANKTTTFNNHENAVNAEDADFVHLPNPRKTQQKRTPFKDINILDVVVLPSWKKNLPTTPSKEVSSTRVSTIPAATASPAHRTQTRANLFGFDEILPCESTPSKSTEPQIVSTPPSNELSSTTTYPVPTASPANHSQTQTNDEIPRKQKKTRASNSKNLFGFEEFITENEDVASTSTVLSQNETLHEKLHRLGELRPSDKELPEVSSTSSRGNYLEGWASKQRDIRDVFCSTMISVPKPRKRQAALAAEETIGLFKENEADPEKTFDEKQPRRTYVKELPQRKRKKRVQLLYIESESEDEDEQDSHETSFGSPQKKQPQNKRPRRDIEHEAKLKEFITSFNKECEEVEKFPVIIE
ncbi:protein dalmatian [Drosophila elegans]|uniref:protein dalmatian n=1 Tax=Drosophila elegans TaxID=30023 RepID=UPI0007E5CD8F|nr:protein dalmatian [Drosophila elegans]